MDRILAKFVHGATEVIRDIEVDSADDPPLTFSVWLPTGYPADELPTEEPREAVYTREHNLGGDPEWIYRFRAILDPEE